MSAKPTGSSQKRAAEDEIEMQIQMVDGEEGSVPPELEELLRSFLTHIQTICMSSKDCKDKTSHIYSEINKGVSQIKNKSRYQVRRKQLVWAGSGASAVVYRYSWMGISIALKYLKDDDPESITLFNQEIEFLLSLHHPYCCQFIEQLSDRCVATRFYPSSLKDLIPRDDIMFPDRFRIAYQITCGLEYLHSKNMVHQDLKPDNILLDEYNDVKIADFGLAEFADKVGDKQEGNMLYMAPEKFSNKKFDGKKCDVFSLGLILWELFSSKILQYIIFKDQNGRKINAIELIEINKMLPTPKEMTSNEEIKNIFVLAASCYSINSNDRPDLKHVRRLIKRSGFRYMFPDDHVRHLWKKACCHSFKNRVELSEIAKAIRCRMMRALKELTSEVEGLELKQVLYQDCFGRDYKQLHLYKDGKETVHRTEDIVDTIKGATASFHMDLIDANNFLSLCQLFSNFFMNPNEYLTMYYIVHSGWHAPSFERALDCFEEKKHIKFMIVPSLSHSCFYLLQRDCGPREIKRNSSTGKYECELQLRCNTKDTELQLSVEPCDNLIELAKQLQKLTEDTSSL